MSILTESPSPINQLNPNWTDQVKVGRGHQQWRAADYAVELARRLHCAGVWNGLGSITLHEPVQVYERLKAGGAAMVAGEDFEYADDSAYQGSGPATAQPAEPPAEEVLEALLNSMWPETLAKMVADLRQSGYELFGGWGVDHWTTEYEVAHRRLMALGAEFVSEEEFAEMVRVEEEGVCQVTFMVEEVGL